MKGNLLRRILIKMLSLPMKQNPWWKAVTVEVRERWQLTIIHLASHEAKESCFTEENGALQMYL